MLNFYLDDTRTDIYIAVYGLDPCKHIKIIPSHLKHVTIETVLDIFMLPKLNRFAKTIMDRWFENTLEHIFVLDNNIIVKLPLGSSNSLVYVCKTCELYIIDTSYGQYTPITDTPFIKSCTDEELGNLKNLIQNCMDYSTTELVKIMLLSNIEKHK